MQLPDLLPGDVIEIYHPLCDYWYPFTIDRIEDDDMGRGRILWTTSGSGYFIDLEGNNGRVRRKHPVGRVEVA